jgi:hypothetical protein
MELLMAQNGSSPTERSKKATPLNLMPVDFLKMSMRRVEDFVSAQSQIFEQIQKSNKERLGRLQSEEDLACKLAVKLVAAQSLPDGMTVCQKWGSGRFERMTDEGNHVLADDQKFMEMRARLLANGWTPNGGAGTSR